jgi:heptosyltransferase-2
MARPVHLIVKLGAIGDVVMALPAVKLFKERTGGEIHWMCGRTVVPLLRRFPFIDRLVEVNDRALLGPSPLASAGEIVRVWTMLAGRRYDTCAVLYYDWRYRLLVLPVRKKRLVTLSRSNRARRLLPGRYHGDEYARILLGEDGLRPDRVTAVRPSSRLLTTPLAKGIAKRVALVPGGARNALRDDPQRRWPLSYYVELAGALVARRYEVVLAGGPDDTWVSQAFAGLPVKNSIGRLSLDESIALFDTCDLVISHDAGPLHMATLSSAAVLALFGPTFPGERLPSHPELRVLWGGERLACRPCYDGREFAACSDNRCMKEISPSVVLAAAEEMLAEAPARGDAG